MKRIIGLAVLLALAPAAGAQLYKWVDKNGKTVYSDQPPANVESRQLHIPSGTSAPSAPAKSYVERDKELGKGRKEALEQSKKAEQSAKLAQEAEERCNAARSNLKVYEAGGRILKRNAAGERVYLDDREIEVEREKARAFMEEACKKS